MRGCLVYAATNVCTAVIEYTSVNDLVIADGFYLAPDSTGEVGWTWTGSSWVTPTSFWTDVRLYGTPRAPTPDTEAADDQIATTFWVRNFVSSYLADEDYLLDGGDYGDAASLVIYNAGRYNGTGNNLTADLLSPLYDGTGGNLSGDIDGGTFA